jgi:hypothetical protein
MDRVDLKLAVTPETLRLLAALGRHGLFGVSAEDVAERLLTEKLREIVKDGWAGSPLGVDTQPLVRT